jgi:hypothetical protein
MKFCISIIHLGRYKLEILDNNYQIVWGADGGSAFIMVQLCKWIFEPEHAQYQRDQRASSDKIAETVIGDMRRSPEKYVSPKLEMFKPTKTLELKPAKDVDNGN